MTNVANNAANNALQDKANSLADRMNRLTAKLNLSEELLVQGSDIVDFVEEKTKTIELYQNPSYADIMNIQIMTEDFKYVRETLREVTDNARRVQNAITLELIDTDSEKRAALVVSFAELSKAITDAQKLYVDSYRQMSNTLLNLDKIKKADPPPPSNVTNNLHIHGTETVSTFDLIAALQSRANNKQKE